MGPNRREWIKRLPRLILAVAGPCLLASVPLPGWPGRGSIAGIICLGLAALLLAAWLAILAPDRRQDQRWARQHPLWWWGTLALGSGIITASLVGPNLHATWSVIDDHDYVALLGPQGRITAGQLAHEIAHSQEIARPTIESRRYRPTFWLLRLTEIYLWGNRPQLYWATRVAMFGISVCLAWWALWVWLGGAAAGLVLALTLTFPFWCDIWCRLGCSEAHGTLGTAMLGAAVAGIVLETRRIGPWRRERWNAWWLLLATGAILAVGAKENFLVYLPVVWVFMVWVARQRRLGTVAWTAGLLTTLVGLWIAAVIVVATSHAGVDVYDQPTGMGHRLQALFAWMTTGNGGLWVLLGCVAGAFMLVACFLARHAPCSRRQCRALTSNGILFVIFAATVLSQVFFYNGTFPSLDHSRYDFPGLAALLLAGVAAEEMITRGLWNVGTRLQIGNALRTVALIALGVVVLVRGFETLKHESRWNALASRQFVALIDSIAKEVTQSPRRPLIFVANSAEWQEQVHSVIRFLRVRQVVNPAFLFIPPGAAAAENTPVGRRQAAAMNQWSERGGNGFLPRGQFHMGQRPFGLFFGGTPVFVEPVEMMLHMTSRGPLGAAPPPDVSPQPTH